jgi:hypothetical protein
MVQGEVSAKTGEGAEEAFLTLTRKMPSKHPIPPPPEAEGEAKFDSPRSKGLLARIWRKKSSERTRDDKKLDDLA